MKSRFMLFLCLMFTAGSALAADLNVPSGEYTHQRYNYPNSEKEFTLLKRGTHVVFIDEKHAIRYHIDLNNQGDQVAPEKWLELIRNSPGGHVIGRTIKKVWLTGLSEYGPDELQGKLHLLFQSDSLSYGSLNAELQIGVSLKTKPCTIRISDANFNSKEKPTTCLVSQTGLSMDLVSLETTLGAVPKWLGLLLDFTFKLLSPLISSQDVLYNIPRD